jgi:Imidazoleglycerol-phosphate dehydratase
MLTVDLQNFLSGFSNGAKCTLHVNIKEGEDPHHIWESVFRALGEALKMCFERNEFRKGTTVGVKGI